MTWTLDGPALDEVVHATSTATARAAGVFRLFGLDPWQLGMSRGGPTPVAPGPCTDGPTLTYLETPSTFAPPSFTTSGAALRASCIPSRKLGVRWLVHAPNSNGDTTEPHVERTLDVVYKDPTIVRLPDGSWLIVVARYRAAGTRPAEPRGEGQARGDGAGPPGGVGPGFPLPSPEGRREPGPGAPGPQPGPGSPLPSPEGRREPGPGAPRPGLQAPIAAKPGASLGDLVAWHAPDPSFTANVTGPYWLMDARTADPDTAAPPPAGPGSPAALPAPGGEARIPWIGVPGAVVRGRGESASLELYFVVEPEGDARTRLLPSDPAAPRTPAWNREPVASGVVLARFDWPTLRGALAAPAPDERSWDTTTAIASTVVGRVRTWWAGAPGEVVPLAEQFPSPDLHIADPAPLRCGAERVLFFAGIHGRPEKADPAASGGLGVWRGAPLPANAPVCVRGGPTCAPLTPTPGLDFVVGPGDRLATSRGASVFLDPDPYAMFGGVRVNVGNLAEDASDALGLVRVRGSTADACRGWRGAWSD